MQAVHLICMAAMLQNLIHQPMYVHCYTETFSHTPSHRTLLGIKQQILSITREPTPSVLSPVKCLEIACKQFLLLLDIFDSISSHSSKNVDRNLTTLHS